MSLLLGESQIFSSRNIYANWRDNRFGKIHKHIVVCVQSFPCRIKNNLQIQTRKGLLIIISNSLNELQVVPVKIESGYKLQLKSST